MGTEICIQLLSLVGENCCCLVGVAVVGVVCGVWSGECGGGCEWWWAGWITSLHRERMNTDTVVYSTEDEYRHSGV